MNIREERARRLHEAGLIAREAATRLGVSTTTMERIWWRLGLRRKRPSLSGEELAQFREQVRKQERARERRKQKRHEIEGRAAQ